MEVMEEEEEDERKAKQCITNNNTCTGCLYTILKTAAFKGRKHMTVIPAKKRWRKRNGERGIQQGMKTEEQTMIKKEWRRERERVKKAGAQQANGRSPTQHIRGLWHNYSSYILHLFNLFIVGHRTVSLSKY